MSKALTLIGSTLILTALAAYMVLSHSVAAAAAVPQMSHTQLHIKPLAGTSTYQNGYTPEQIRGAYNLASTYEGAGITIAIVDAYNDPSALKDFDVFSSQFGLPTLKGGCGCLTVVNQSGGTKLPRNNGGWAEEISLDIEWAHSMAPLAHILLVEASSASNSNLYAAETYAAAHAQVVSNSWGGNESSGELSQDTYFNKSVAITVSAGDSGSPAQYPSSSPYVLSVGGTTLNVSGTCGTTNWTTTGCSYGSETAWSKGGGGPSAYESEPAYQTGYCGTLADVNNCAGKRGTPDVAWVGDPNTGVAVYDSTSYQGYVGWLVFGGTSVGAPNVAGVIADADAAHNTVFTTNNLSSRFTYQLAATTSNYSTDYHDVTSGSNGSPCCQAGTGYDFTTGLGTFNANNWIGSI